MIAFFPKVYSDELLYSQISRYHARSGYTRFVFTAEDIYKAGKITHPSIEFVNPYTDDAMNWLTKELTWETVTEKHTMYSAYIRFLPLQRRKEAIEGLISQKGNWKNTMNLPLLKEKRFLRYCPECAREDREKYGETYWHREHQIPRIRICPKHRTILENSNVPIGSKTTPGLFDAQNHVPENSISRLCNNQRETEFTQYVLDVFRSLVDIETDFSIGTYLQAKVPQKYKSKMGLMHHISQFYIDYTVAFAGMPIMAKSYMQKIFNGYIFDVYYILQLAFFIGISVYDITHIPSKTNQLNDLFKRLAEKHNLDYAVVSDIAEEIAKQKVPKVSNISGPRKREYEKLDSELLPKVKAVVDEIIGKDGKPERVSPTKIQRLMGLPQKQFNKLPLCKEYIESKAETQEEYHKRNVEWSVAEIERRGGIVTLSKVMKLTNIRSEDIKMYLMEIEHIKDWL